MAQIFTNEGLDVIFNQLSIGTSGSFTPSATPATYYVGLLTGGSGSTVPASSATLSAFGGSFAEMTGSGYIRQATTFTLSGTSASTSVLSTTLSSSATIGSWVVTLTSTTGLLIGMNITVGTESVKVITGLPSGNQVVLSSALVANQSSGATVTAGDAVNGQKALGSQVTFTATGTWTASTGYFITNVASGTSGKTIFFANFADLTTPQLGANDTLKVTPTWLMSN